MHLFHLHTRNYGPKSQIHKYNPRGTISLGSRIVSRNLHNLIVSAHAGIDATLPAITYDWYLLIANEIVSEGSPISLSFVHLQDIARSICHSFLLSSFCHLGTNQEEVCFTEEAEYLRLYR